MIERLDRSNGRVLGFTVSGKLHDADYQHFLPTVDAAIAEHGKVRLLVQLVDFQGWDLPALWDDIKFGVTHYSKFDRIAFVGGKSWEAWLAKICAPFTRAELRHFDPAALDAAWAWLEETTDASAAPA